MLEKEYVNSTRSRKEASKYFQISEEQLTKLLTFYMIPTRPKSMQNAIKNSKIRKTKAGFTQEIHQQINTKRKSTVNSKYGVSNVSKLPSIISKIHEIKSSTDESGLTGFQRSAIATQKTVRQRYGVDCVFQTQDVKEKTKRTLFQKYGVSTPYQFTPRGVSKASQDLFWAIYAKLPKSLQNCCYFKEYNYEFGKHDTKFNRYYYYDFVVSSIKFCIEFNGEMYHPNKELLSEEAWKSWKILFGTQTADEVYEKDERKIAFLEQQGFTVKVIWWNSYIADPSKTCSEIVREIEKISLNYIHESS